MTSKVAGDGHAHQVDSAQPGLDVRVDPDTSIQIITTQVRIDRSEKSSDHQPADHPDDLKLPSSKEHDLVGNFGTFNIRGQVSGELDRQIDVDQALSILCKAVKASEETSRVTTDELRLAQERLVKNQTSFKDEVENTLNRLERTHVMSTGSQSSDDFGNPDVLGIVPQTDDPSVPVSTFRVWFIGLWFSVIGSCINNFFAERLPGIGISGFVAQVRSRRL